jgi:predicted nuclease of predicted toxin-antitoxin system
VPRLCHATRQDTRHDRPGVVKFIIDAQLPRRLAIRLVERGHDAAHTLDLPDGNRTKDSELWERADAEQAVVVTKDADFIINRTLHGHPLRLLVIATGNIANDELMRIIEANLAGIEKVCAVPGHVSLGRTFMIVRE